MFCKVIIENEQVLILNQQRSEPTQQLSVMITLAVNFSHYRQVVIALRLTVGMMTRISHLKLL